MPNRHQRVLIWVILATLGFLFPPLAILKGFAGGVVLEIYAAVDPQNQNLQQ